MYLFCTGKVDEKATQLHAIASLKAVLEATKPNQRAASVAVAKKLKTSTSSSCFDSCEKNEIAMNLTSCSSDRMVNIENSPK